MKNVFNTMFCSKASGDISWMESSSLVQSINSAGFELFRNPKLGSTSSSSSSSSEVKFSGFGGGF
jgi:hypothetical protein